MNKDEKIKCKYCGSIKIVKKGLRKLKRENKQVYSCKDCNKRFSIGLSNRRFNVKVIINSICAYNNGYNYEEICDLIARKNKIVISRSSIARWVKEYDLGYLNIRERIIRKYGNNLVIGRMFKHSGLIYNFKYHKGKLKEFSKFNGLKDFIFNLSKGVNDNLFKGSRCSNVKENVNVNVKVVENSKLCKSIGDALKLIKSNKQRHAIVEEFMLSCDRDTIAVEVPIWYWDKINRKGVCGHIDILQVKYGKIWILDYKPNASKEDINSVVSQLYNYAIGLSFRSKIKLRDIKCGWFDEEKMFSFNVDEVRLGR